MFTKGVALVLFGYLNFALIDIIVSQAEHSMHALKIFYFQVLFSSIFLFPWVARQKGRFFKTKNLRLHVFRAIVAIASVFFFYSALQIIPPVDAVLLKSTSPIFTPILALFVFKERVLKRVWPLIFLGLFGVYLIIGPFNSSFTFVHLYPLVSALAVSYITLAVYKLGKEDSPKQIVYSMNITGLIFLTPIVLLNWEPIPNHLWMMFVLQGLLFSLAQICFVKAYTLSTPGRLAPFLFSEVFFVFVFLRLFFSVSISMKEILGGAIIVSSMSLIFYLTRNKEEEASFD